MTVAAEARAHATASASAWIAGGIVCAAVLFNAVLAIVNGHIKPLGPGAVVACEAAIVLAAHLVAITHLRPSMLPWYGLLIPISLFAVLRSIDAGTFEARYARDLALIPTFYVLGLTYPREKLASLLVALQMIVFAGLLLEWASLDAFAWLFKIKDYYINTRGATEASFWNTESTLFVSATRPDDRFFSFVSWHRMSSVFLEPVSLGNYCIFVASCLFALPHLLTRWQKLLLAVTTIVMLIACDGRLASVTILAIGIVALIAWRLPPRATLLFPLIVLAAAIAVVVAFGLKDGSDTFPGRIAHTVTLLGRFTLSDYMGLSDALLRWFPIADRMRSCSSSE